MLININFSRGAKCDLCRDAEPTEPYHFYPVRGVCDGGNMTKPLMPAFVFMRHPDIEHQGRFLLAGILVVDLPKAAKENKRNMRLVEEIVQELTERAQSGVLGDELTVGWVGRHKPQKAVDQYDDASLAAWARGCLRITVRIGPRADGQALVYH